jgi:hypothetical protein
MRVITATKDDGYRGIWYMNQPTKDAYRYKYSGGFATYPQQHVPIAIYSAKANKTFFVYGGTARGKNELLHLISYYDHRTGQVPRPALLLNKRTDDAHDNATLAIDDAGHLWIFSNAHGTSRPSFIHRSTKPFEIYEWEKIQETNFSYGQPWYLPGKGFVFMHTRYNKGRGLHVMTSRDGMTWDPPQAFSSLAEGHYQVSGIDVRSGKLATAFDYHPNMKAKSINEAGLNHRTNLYYVETPDAGKTWRTVEGKPVRLPLTEVKNSALVHDYEAEGSLVYLKDTTFDAEGNPIILYLTSKSFSPGPKGDPRTWKTARWTGKEWERRVLTTSDHNYDHGSLYVEGPGRWRVIAPTEPGPQPSTTGGEMVVWTTADAGATWKREKQLTKNSPRNHTYARRPHLVHPDFYAFWADGNSLEPSASYLYFTDRTGSNVWRLPERMTGEFAKPEPIF